MKALNISRAADKVQQYKEWTITYLGHVSSVLVFYYSIQHCFICRASDSPVSEDAGIESRTVATLALTARRSNHSARSHPFVDEILLFSISDSDPDPALSVINKNSKKNLGFYCFVTSL